MKSQIFHLKRQAIAQNFALGIDPGKEKHSGSVTASCRGRRETCS